MLLATPFPLLSILNVDGTFGAVAVILQPRSNSQKAKDDEAESRRKIGFSIAWLSLCINSRLHTSRVFVLMAGDTSWKSSRAYHHPREEIDT